MRLVVSVCWSVCPLVSVIPPDDYYQSKKFVYVCNLGAFADNLADAVHWLLILGIHCMSCLCNNHTITYKFSSPLSLSLLNSCHVAAGI